MSYCVNCGVELEESLRECPLCNTPVVNPADMEKKYPKSPYPTSRGSVEQVKKADVAILVSALLISTSLLCLLLNQFILPLVRWSYLVAGACMLMWIFVTPLMAFRNVSPYAAVSADGVGIILYLFLITLFIRDDKWFYGIGAPVVVLGTLLILAIITLHQNINKSRLWLLIFITMAIGIYCVGIELIIRVFLDAGLAVSWSAIVMTVCIVITIGLLTVVFDPRLREAARRRLHF